MSIDGTQCLNDIERISNKGKRSKEFPCETLVSGGILLRYESLSVEGANKISK